MNKLNLIEMRISNAVVKKLYLMFGYMELRHFRFVGVQMLCVMVVQVVLYQILCLLTCWTFESSCQVFG